MRRERGLARLLCGLIASTSLAARAESLSADGSLATVVSFSSSYKTRKDTVPAVTFRYSKELAGRWSIGGMYLTSLQGVFSGYGLGVSFDSRPTHAESGEMTPDGGREVRSVAKWLLRGSGTLGIWRYLATLDRSAPALGEKPQAPVEAELYGVALGASLVRFLDDRYALSLNATNVSSLASDFSVTALALGLGVTWYY